MEQNIPVFAKKVWRLVRVLYFMLRKNISKSKLLLDLNRMMKRRKIADKSSPTLSPPQGEYEFSCTDSPTTNNHAFSLFSFRKKHTSANQHTEDLDMMAVNAAVLRAMEMINSEAASPALPGFGRSPVVRQLRVSDSPFPLSNVDEDSHVDEAAEQFINRFYSDLRRQNCTNVTSLGSSS
ncbi:hypothetical protein HanXRQr2_Chr09g0415781 [Helianthus annuus]|uniref:Avr9/Cf-9 rapidly elicited protein 146 n=1 Tax=Helianthus annuus TaxID=4232 RepID=A0A9K3IBV8_HELAN|nr:uncharacterized protein LOC110880167 [Helianthus annuus]KAF5793289.1 hypothetical protein HanXRQr2_Chr09g0415781 [Helianthus annuus]KAJ0528131.1 hypothetical protein HanHA300_Chr09g0341791 [Helianthus annuus]KAJ0537008.1 hypothetical protein HanIR_Chr09g0447981 [Helianthus annuus]KAJ0544562.1 hypothetical protein HanHA89_Chr09g0363031 [Helianthus annuus]KAJ0895563.1 hypothetical protein HanPSC8_Chr09g0402021 [Helianthus annuus]